MTTRHLREAYAAIGDAWVRRFDIKVGSPVRGWRGRRLVGLANVPSRTVRVPYPATTLRRLYLLAHEIGHVALQHDDPGVAVPEYVTEFEAEMFARALFRAEVLSVPEETTISALINVAGHLADASLAGLKVDPAILRWATGSDGYWEAKRDNPNDVDYASGYFAAAKTRIRNAITQPQSGNAGTWNSDSPAPRPVIEATAAVNVSSKGIDLTAETQRGDVARLHLLDASKVH